VKISFLLPTRNGGAYIREAIDSVLAQPGDIELVIADNANTDETPGILDSFRTDPRVRISRSEAPITVTENWMQALRASSGDYMLMIGDDDALVPSFRVRAEEALVRNAHPDCLTFDGYTYVAPGSFGPDALWSPRHFDTRRLHPERELPLQERVDIVRDFFRFKGRFPLNMQLTLFARTTLDRVSGDLFRAPFPDHFALNTLLLRARRFVVSGERLVIVGVSPKSFGHYFYSGGQAEGVKYLGSSSQFPGRLEGSELVNSMHVWLAELRNSFPELRSMRIDRWGYVARQVNHWLRQAEFGLLPRRALATRARSLSLSELITVGAPIFLYRVARRLRAKLAGRPYTYIADQWPALRATQHRRISDFAAALPEPE
jgi:glycosyltransferase involved in cell wall biosynthesis